jgi:hypothetical protein
MPDKQQTGRSASDETVRVIAYKFSADHRRFNNLVRMTIALVVSSDVPTPGAFLP